MNERENKDAMSPGQQNAPREGQTHYSPAEQKPEEILSGARNEDQLEQLRSNATGADEKAQADEQEHIET